MENYYFYTDHLTVGYDGKALIRDICIELERGKIVTLIGPNGAGKSTILKTAAGQISRLSGKVYLDGKDILSYDAADLSRHMSVLFTERNHTELMTAYDVAAAGRYPYTGRLGILREEDRAFVQEAMESMKAWELRDCLFEALSDGQKQRVLLARAICQDPDLIILDEPTSFLDVRHKLEFLTLLRRMAYERKIAVLLSLHELDLARKISDRVVCVRADRILDQGTVEEIFTEEKICSLFDLPPGSFSPEMVSAELPAVRGESSVFVIAGGGTAVNLYRRLQREKIPFATGVLNESDIDAVTARHLANELFSIPSFAQVGGEDIKAAARAMRRCGKVISTVSCYGPQNEKIRELVRMAEAEGILYDEENYFMHVREM